jgi:hypothetical protein
VLSRRALHTARTALWITCGWIGAARVPEELQIEDMGEQELRGKAEALRLYSVRARVQAVYQGRIAGAYSSIRSSTAISGSMP